ncbi:hypothetical protein SAMN05216480_103110 [Pustulibacterium marinum]|uniref:Uncharacterized protein n=1 Tax=Pustulibacterium marinum TaxID=1224947 RepID=A0A1I7G2W2_9FLAO|nr:ribonuclease Z [Pustulibacterium marinum]SFU42795.1 hypothetical protein SAMN05216480_103110 [Pustulibacterium marinum]
MILSKNDNTSIVTNEKMSVGEFIKNYKEAYERIKSDHIIINLFSINKLSVDDLLEFLPLSNAHRERNKSFVIVASDISYDDLPDELEVVPTLQEAHDIIEMEEIERDLDFDA